MGRKGGRKAGGGARLMLDESHILPRRLGGGSLRMQVWTDAQGRVVRYSLAYVNRALCQRDNGRVLGYDDAHGSHHRHYLGEVQTIEFVSFEHMLECFEREWRAIAHANFG